MKDDQMSRPNIQEGQQPNPAGLDLNYFALRFPSSREELECALLQLAACGVAAIQDTVERRQHRLKSGHPDWSASYADVCRRVDECIELRDQLTKANRQIEDFCTDYRLKCDVETKQLGQQVVDLQRELAWERLGSSKVMALQLEMQKMQRERDLARQAEAPQGTEAQDCPKPPGPPSRTIRESDGG